MHPSQPSLEALASQPMLHELVVQHGKEGPALPRLLQKSGHHVRCPVPHVGCRGVPAAHRPNRLGGVVHLL